MSSGIRSPSLRLAAIIGCVWLIAAGAYYFPNALRAAEETAEKGFSGLGFLYVDLVLFLYFAVKLCLPVLCAGMFLCGLVGLIHLLFIQQWHSPTEPQLCVFLFVLPILLLVAGMSLITFCPGLKECPGPVDGISGLLFFMAFLCAIPSWPIALIMGIKGVFGKKTGE